MEGRRWLPIARAALALVCLSPWVGAGEPDVYRFLIPETTASPGESVRIAIQGEHTEAVQGFSLALRYPGEDLTVLEVHFRDTILEAVGTDYFQVKLSPQEGTLVVGVLVDADPPFDGAMIPAIGRPLDFIYLEASISPTAKADLHLRFENGLSTPPIENLFSVANEPVPVTELGEGTIHVSGAGEGAVFVRGDANADRTLDLSDPILILSSIFGGSGRIPCRVAADANDDEAVDVSDPVYLLQYLFLDGDAPPAPGFEGGTDPTAGSLGCEVPPR